MINDFEDFCLYVYVIVDDLCQQLAPLLRRPGPAPRCSDSELIVVCLIGECKGWDLETDLLSNMRDYERLFPQLPEQSRLNRRRRGLMWVMNVLRRLLLRQLDIAQDRQCIIDSLPIEVVHFHLVPSCQGDWGAYGASFGKVTTKKQTIYGYKLHLLITLGGLILDFELAPAHLTDLAVGAELLAEQTDLLVIGDKGYISAQQAAHLLESSQISDAS